MCMNSFNFSYFWRGIAGTFSVWVTVNVDLQFQRREREREREKCGSAVFMSKTEKLWIGGLNVKTHKMRSCNIAVIYLSALGQNDAVLVSSNADQHAVSVIVIAKLTVECYRHFQWKPNLSLGSRENMKVFVAAACCSPNICTHLFCCACFNIDSHWWLHALQIWLADSDTTWPGSLRFQHRKTAWSFNSCR